MSRKTSKARVEAFFAALAETGNQTISAERACVSRSWVTLHRSTDPAFKARMEECIAAARRMLSGAASQAPVDTRWWDIDGEEVVVRGSNGRRAQMSRARLNQWTPRIEARFLTVLASTCNVKAACAAVGMSPASAYVRRSRWAEFERRWSEALEIGYIRLEFAIIENACNTMERIEPDWDSPIPPMTFDQALQYLSLHRKSVVHKELPKNRWRKPVDMDALGEDIIRKLAAIRAHAAQGDHDAAVEKMLKS